MHVTPICAVTVDFELGPHFLAISLMLDNAYCRSMGGLTKIRPEYYYYWCRGNCAKNKKCKMAEHFNTNEHVLVHEVVHFCTGACPCACSRACPWAGTTTSVCLGIFMLPFTLLMQPWACRFSVNVV